MNSANVESALGIADSGSASSTVMTTGGRGWRWGLHNVYGCMGGGAQRAVGVTGGAIGMDVGDLCGPGNHDQKDAEQREEESPRALRALSGVPAAHI